MVKLISHTYDPNNGFTPEQLIVFSARVSNPTNQHNMETAPRLITFLIKNRHWSPFELVNFTFEIKTTRAIVAQILRHRSFSFQEFSQRYSTVNNIHPVDLRKQAVKNRQSSEDEFIDDELETKINKLFNDSTELYQEMLDKGVAREVSRGVLPLNSETTLYMNGNVRSWLSWLNVRLETYTQKEHRDLAVDIGTELSKFLPDTYKATEEFGNMEGGFM